MAALRSSTLVSAGPREYDPEIKDMASYVHSYKIDSALAVSRLLDQTLVRLLMYHSLILHDTYYSTPWAVGLKPFALKNVRNF